MYVHKNRFFLNIYFIVRKNSSSRISYVSFFFLFLLTAIDNAGDEGDTLERLRNITKMFSTKDEEPQQLTESRKICTG